MEEHGGRIVARALKSRGVEHLFTLSGGHLFSLYDGCREEGIAIVDVRHEQTAAFAAEGMAKATRGIGVAALTAGPGVTNGISAIAGAQANGSPICVLGGRAPEMRWGSGSLQEIDHLPFVSPLVKSAATVKETGAIAAATAAALDLAAAAPSGPTFVDYPMDVVFTEAEVEIPAAAGAPPRRSPPQGVEEAAALLAGAERPAIMAGTGLYWARGEEELRALAEALGIPVFLNGLGRGCLPADHDLAFSRARSTALQDADVALVIGVPMDFRLGFGGSFGAETKLVRVDVAPNALTANRLPDVDLVGDVAGDAGGAARGGRRGRDAHRGPGSSSCATSSPRSARAEQRGARTTRARRCTRCASTRSSARCSTATRSSSATAATSSPTRAATSTPTSRAAGWTRARSAASAPAPARRSAPSSPIPTGRSACCSATAPSASPGWSSTRWPATASASSG